MRPVAGPAGHAETSSWVVDAITRRGLSLFAQIDHAAPARNVGMALADEVLVGFVAAIPDEQAEGKLDSDPWVTLLDEIAHEAAAGAASS